MSVIQLKHRTQRGDLLHATLYGAEQHGVAPCLVYAHGFKGFKDWAFVPYAGEYFAQRGYSFLCFNFSHNGIGEDGQTFSELDKFEQNTFSLEISELEEVITQVAHTDLLGSDLHGKLGLIGHSRGGGIAVLAAQNRPEVQALATWASVSTFDRYEKEVCQAWRKRGYHEVVNSRTGQTLRLGTALLDEVERQAQTKLNILAAARKFQRPWLILHGQEDDTVPFFEAEQLNIYGHPDLTELRLIPGAGHTFGATHPQDAEQVPAPLTQLLDATCTFFDQHLR